MVAAFKYLPIFLCTIYVPECRRHVFRKIYVQVTQEIQTEKTEKREYNRLLRIKDNYPKYVLRTDAFAAGNYQGVKTMQIADFLLSEDF